MRVVNARRTKAKTYPLLPPTTVPLLPPLPLLRLLPMLPLPLLLPHCSGHGQAGGVP